MEHLLTSEEVAELLHVDPVTIRRLVNKSELSAYRIGADYRFAPSDLQSYLQRQRIFASAESAAGVAGNPFDAFTQRLRKALQAKSTTPLDLVLRARFDLFTRRAREVLTLSEEEARRLQHNYIGTEHLLLGLLREKEGVATRVLTNLGVDLQQVRDAIEAIIGRGERIVPGEQGLTPRARKVIELSVDEACRLNYSFIGTEHLLLGLIREGEGIAAGVLESLGVNLQQARAETLRLMRQFQAGDAPAAHAPAEAATLLGAEEQGLTCERCGVRSPLYFHFCFNCGQQLAGEAA